MRLMAIRVETKLINSNYQRSKNQLSLKQQKSQKPKNHRILSSSESQILKNQISLKSQILQMIFPAQLFLFLELG